MNIIKYCGDTSRWLAKVTLGDTSSPSIRNIITKVQVPGRSFLKTMAMKIQVLRYEDQTKNGSKFVAYIASVEHVASAAKWEVPIRYSTFHEFYTKISKTDNKVGSLTFPPKTFFAPSCATRCEQLDKFVTQLSAMINELSAAGQTLLNALLQVDSHVPKAAPEVVEPTSEPEVSAQVEEKDGADGAVEEPVKGEATEQLVAPDASTTASGLWIQTGGTMYVPDEKAVPTVMPTRSHIATDFIPPAAKSTIVRASSSDDLKNKLWVARPTGIESSSAVKQEVEQVPSKEIEAVTAPTAVEVTPAVLVIPAKVEVTPVAVQAPVAPAEPAAVTEAPTVEAAATTKAPAITEPVAKASQPSTTATSSGLWIQKGGSAYVPDENSVPTVMPTQSHIATDFIPPVVKPATIVRNSSSDDLKNKLWVSSPRPTPVDTVSSFSAAKSDSTDTKEVPAVVVAAKESTTPVVEKLNKNAKATLNLISSVCKPPVVKPASSPVHASRPNLLSIGSDDFTASSNDEQARPPLGSMDSVEFSTTDDEFYGKKPLTEEQRIRRNKKRAQKRRNRKAASSAATAATVETPSSPQ
ncbi:unnamed protein product [Aphanomyces euteiches]